MARNQIVRAIQARTETEVIRSVITEAIGSVDELASHYMIAGVDMAR